MAVALGVVLILYFSAVAIGRDVTVGIYDNPPLTAIDEHGTASGFLVDLLEAVSGEEGWILSYVPCVWSSCLELLAAGDIDLLAAIAETEERSQNLDFTHKGVVTNFGQLVTSPELSIAGIGDLNGMVVAVLPGDAHAIAFDGEASKWGVTCGYIESPDYATVLKLVERGEADAGVVNSLFVNQYEGTAGFTVTSVRFNPVCNRYAAPKGVGSDLLEAIDRHLATWKANEDSIYYELRAKWFGEDRQAFLPLWAIWSLASLGGLTIWCGGGVLMLRWRVNVRTRQLTKMSKGLEQALDEIEQAHEIGGLGRWEVNHKRRATTWSARAGKLFGFDADKCHPTYEAFLEAVHPEDRDRVRRAFALSIEGGGPCDITHRLLSEGGIERFVRQVCRTQTDSRGTPVRTVGLVQDITRQMRQAKALKESERRFRLLYEDAPVGCMTLEQDGSIAAVNEVCATEYGLTNETAKGMAFLDLVAETSRADAVAWFERLKADGDVLDEDLTSKRCDGSEFVANVTGSCRWTANGTPDHYHLVIYDVTERRRVQDRIAHLSRVLQALSGINRLMFRTSDLKSFLKQSCKLLVSHRGYFNVWIVLLDAHGDLSMWSNEGDFGDCFPVFLDRIRDNALPECVRRSMDTAAQVRVSDPAEACAGCPLSTMYAGRTGFTEATSLPDAMSLVIGASLPRDLAGDSREREIFRQIAMDIDYGVRNLLQGEALRESEERYGHLFKNSIDAVMFADADGMIREVNLAACRMFGYGMEEMEGMPFAELHENREAASVMMKEIQEDGATSLQDAILVRKDRTSLICQRAISSIRSSEDEVIGFEGIIRDVTKERRSEKRLKQQLRNMIETLARVTELRDPYTAGHQERVARIAVAVAGTLGWTEERIHVLGIAAKLHDIGKIAIPAEILSKPAPLAKYETLLVRGHTEIAARMLRAIDFEGPVQEIILQHHERLDGSGYPRGLRSNQILDEAKIIGVADVVEAMSSHRPYRPSRGLDAALAEIEAEKGVLYDEIVVDACLQLFREKDFQFSEALGRAPSSGIGCCIDKPTP